MRRILIFTTLIFFQIVASAQDLHIYYDVHQDSITYLMDGQPVKRANLKKGAEAVLHIVNYNDYLYEVNISTETENYDIPSAGAGTLLNFGGAGDAFRALQDAAGSFGEMGFQLEDNALTTDRDGAVEYESTVSEEARKLSSQFKTALTEMAGIEENIQEYAEEIESDIEAQQFAAFKKEQIWELRTNPNLSTAMIKQISMDYMEQILGMDKGKPFDLEKLFEKADPKNRIGKSIQKYRAETSKLESRFTQLAAIADLLFLQNLPSTELITFKSAFSEAQTRTDAYLEKAAGMEEQMQEIAAWDIREFADIHYLYEEMKDHRFEKKIVLRPDADLTRISISLTPIDSMQLQGLRPKELSPLEVEVFGGLKINASVGISFAGFFERPQDYLVRNGRIIGDDLDAFSPIITSFIHFHPQARRQVSLGGAFGIGIGLGGEGSGLQNYFLGPSLIAGKGQRIVFSTGLMMGKLNRLSQGYQVGDVYDESIVPTKSIYELGYFLGISFNFLGK